MRMATLQSGSKKTVLYDLDEQLSSQLGGFESVGGLAADKPIGTVGKKRPNSAPHLRVVINDKDAHRQVVNPVPPLSVQY